MNKKPPIPPHPNLVRTPTRSFGWLAARRMREQRLALLGVEPVAVLTLPAIAADTRGASFYRRETMALALSLPRHELDRSLERLVELGLLAHRPWNPGHTDGGWQSLPVPARRR